MIERFMFRVWNIERQKYVPASRLCVTASGQMLPDMVEDVIEQCTGMMDKNLKLIFESDIVTNTSGTKWFIRYENAEFRLIYSEPWNGSCSIDQKWADDTELEVIGNIHENKDLLNA